MKPTLALGNASFKKIKATRNVQYNGDGRILLTQSVVANATDRAYYNANQGPSPKR